jgi:hypothetical protein
MRRWPRAWLALALLGGVAVHADDWSYADPQAFRTRHVELSLSIDFEARQLQGAVAIELERVDAHASQLVLDTKDLAILGVSVQTSDIVGATEKVAPIWVSLPYHLGKADPILGSPLVIDLPTARESKLVLRIDYETQPKARGLRWRSPTGPGSRQPPLLYTLTAPINARSWMPVQDSPQVRSTWRVHIHTDGGLAVLMPGTAVQAQKRRGEDGFVLTRPVPAAALALVVGDLHARPLGARTVIHAEAASALKAFGDVEPLLLAGETLLGRYPWDRFDVVVMPAAFPVADLDQPGLALVSPTLAAGAGGRPDALADALLRAWIGPALGGPEWRDRWLGEAIAGYFAERVVAVAFGEARAQALHAPAAAADVLLAGDLQGAGYDDLFITAERNKGRMFLESLAARVGTSRMDALLRDFLERSPAAGPTTAGLLSFLQDQLGADAAVSGTALQDWVHSSAAPVAAVPAAIQAAAAALAAGDLKALGLQLPQWPASQLIAALHAVPDAISPARLAALDHEFSLSARADPAVVAAWLELCLRAGFSPALVPLERYLLATGRFDLVEPLYEQLMQTDSGAGFARRVLAAARPSLDPFVARRLGEIVRP